MLLVTYFDMAELWFLFVQAVNFSPMTHVQSSQITNQATQTCDTFLSKFMTQ